MHNDFTLFLRKYPNGRKVFFYYAYDENGKRRGPWTTKCLKKTAARNYCHSLLKKGSLVRSEVKDLLFVDYAEGFWERDSVYVKYRDSRMDITDAYLINCRKMTSNQILPFFSGIPLRKITSKMINDWLLRFNERKTVRNGKAEIVRYKNTYANTVFGTLNIMLAEAVRRELISLNPCEKVLRLKNDRKKLEILTVDEVRRLFPEDYKLVWGKAEIAYMVNRLASITGMRFGEILGLRGENMFDNYLLVCGQYGKFGFKNTKTKKSRTIPLPPEMIVLLRSLMGKSDTGYVFSRDGGTNPVSQTPIRAAFHRALRRIGINEKEIKRRGLSIHSWRHFLNTELQRQGLTIQQVQSVTGHRSDRMTEWYSHPDARQISDVIRAQAVIAGTADAAVTGL